MLLPFAYMLSSYYMIRIYIKYNLYVVLIFVVFDVRSSCLLPVKIYSLTCHFLFVGILCNSYWRGVQRKLLFANSRHMKTSQKRIFFKLNVYPKAFWTTQAVLIWLQTQMRTVCSYKFLWKIYRRFFPLFFFHLKPSFQQVNFS